MGEKTKGSGKKKRRTGCHKFKQQLTFRVKACGNGPLAMRICNVVSAERSTAKQAHVQHEEARFDPREEDSRAA